MSVDTYRAFESRGRKQMGLTPSNIKPMTLPPKLQFIKQCSGPYCTSSVQSPDRFCSDECLNWFANHTTPEQRRAIENDPDRRYRRIES